MTSDFPIVPAMMTVFALELLESVGPVNFLMGPTVYFDAISFELSGDGIYHIGIARRLSIFVCDRFSPTIL